MSPLDHFLAAGLVFVSLVQISAEETERRADVSRRSFYSAGIGTGATLAGLTLLFWVLQGREITHVGLYPWLGGTAALVGAAAWLLILAAVFALVVKGTFDRFVHPIYKRYSYIMPRTRSELRHSWATSVAAGAGEEIAYRGFLIWYLAEMISLSAGVLISSILFGLSHSYQRRFGILVTFAIGLALALIYVFTASLLLVILIHSTYNMATFAAGRIVLARVGR